MKPIGYRHLVGLFRLDVLEPPVASFVHDRASRSSAVVNGHTEERYPARDAPGDHWTKHLAFALKREGVNLELLAALFRVAPQQELLDWIESSPNSRFTRVAWFLYEWTMGQKLPLPDLTQGNYVPVLDGQRYYAIPRLTTELNVRRQRVVNNLLGTPAYCPVVRRTEKLRQFEAMKLNERAREQMGKFPSYLILRAVQYLYLKETKSSYAIEHISPDRRRTARFVALLQQAGQVDCYSSAELIRLQNEIVDERYAATGLRDFQNYVGESLSPVTERVHYVPPRPQDLPELMEGWLECCQRLRAGRMSPEYKRKPGVDRADRRNRHDVTWPHPIVAATVAGYGFVFLHPFEDGNGRLHRFLIHHALAARGFTPANAIFPVSATMLKQKHLYDASLEAYSLEIAKHVEYDLTVDGSLIVRNETASFYRFPDLTAQCEALFGFIRDTVEEEMLSELHYLSVFEAARRQVREIVDMPDRRLDLFIRLCMQGKGELSKAKRSQFEELTDDECRALEEVVIHAMSVANPRGAAE